ncbi:hypothetical protein [Aquimarina macrocephali]|uniref:hypothetical protein n=1 Tax=Aquimarina macrocephali TaxID=666563 RepID=UPI0004641189|nr:hypothetical protein [Aquimarina macrocephali]
MNLKILFFLAVFGLLFASCSSNDDSGDVKLPIFGTYKLVTYTTNPASDINNDGTASENQTSETDCHDSSFLTLNDDNTFKGKLTFLELKSDTNGMETQNIECFSEGITGTFVLENETVTLSYTFDEVDKTLVLTLVNNQMTSKTMDIDLLTRDDSNTLVFVDATLILIFEK